MTHVDASSPNDEKALALIEDPELPMFPDMLAVWPGPEVPAIPDVPKPDPYTDFEACQKKWLSLTAYLLSGKSSFHNTWEKKKEALGLLEDAWEYYRPFVLFRDSRVEKIKNSFSYLHDSWVTKKRSRIRAFDEKIYEQMDMIMRQEKKIRKLQGMEEKLTPPVMIA